MVWLWERGHDREWVLGLTLEQIADLYEVCERLEARHTVMDAWMQMTAAQGKVKDMKKALEPLTKLLKRSRKGQETNDLAAFLSSRWGKGI